MDDQQNHVFLELPDLQVETRTTDSQDSYNRGVIALVTGFLIGKYNRIRLFTQAFSLAL